MKVRVVKHWFTTYPNNCYRYVPQYLNNLCGWQNILKVDRNNFYDFVNTQEEAIEICKEFKNKNNRHKDEIVWED